MNYLKKMLNSVVEDRWSLGFIEDQIPDILQGAHYKVHYVSGIPNDRWYADPFILYYDDNRVELLVEEWRYAHKIGRLAHLTIERPSYTILQDKIILELDTHLSFPFIRRINGEIYVYPENSTSGTWSEYVYDYNKDILIKTKTKLNYPLTDAVITDFFGEELVFSTCQPDASGNVLSVYTVNGECLQEIKFPSRVARGAGDFFKIGHRIYRPSQDCNGGYGKAVIIQEVIRNNKGEFKFKDVFRITSTHKKFNVGCHTLNSYNGLTVVDVRGYRRRIISIVVVSIKNFLKRLLWRS